MTTATPALDQPRLSAAEVAWIWIRHLASLLLPVNALVFLWTGPHSWWSVPFFIVPIALAELLDKSAVVERRQPMSTLPAWPFDSLVYLLAGLQLLIVFELALMFQHQAIFSVDMLLVLVIVGGSSGFSIITAHELIHRNKRWEQLLGRLLLCTVLYEHFYTEHLRGHHVRVGTPEDPATARFGERFNDFYRRTVPAQFRSAWALEARRLGDPEMKLWDVRMLRNRIVHGIAVGWGVAFAILAVFGLASFVAFLIQAFFASRLLEAVNYFEHWGLTRSGRRVAPVDSWDTHSWFTYYGLTGLSRHADHHSYPSRPFQQLRVYDDAPILPGGYVSMVDMVMARNDEFRAISTEELRRLGLGPFADGGVPPETGSLETDLASASEGAIAGARGRRWRALPVWLRAGVVLLSLAGIATLGGTLEPRGGSFLELLGWNAWVASGFALAFAARALVTRFAHHEGLAWGSFFAVLLGLGLLIG